MAFEKDWAVRSDYWTDDDFLAELREIAASDLPDNEKLELLVRKLDVLSVEDVRRTNSARPAVVSGNVTATFTDKALYDTSVQNKKDSDEWLAEMVRRAGDQL